jgi:DNA invertase Pin-like site-specific DNA recombinase
MEARTLIPAAMYVRMSTEELRYSIANQGAAIRVYAESHGFVVAWTFADAGKSGVAIKQAQPQSTVRIRVVPRY